MIYFVHDQFTILFVRWLVLSVQKSTGGKTPRKQLVSKTFVCIYVKNLHVKYHQYLRIESRF